MLLPRILLLLGASIPLALGQIRRDGSSSSDLTAVAAELPTCGVSAASVAIHVLLRLLTKHSFPPKTARLHGGRYGKLDVYDDCMRVLGCRVTGLCHRMRDTDL